MTGVFSIDIMTMIFGLILPFWVALSVCVALAIGRRLNTFMVGDYVREVVDENNRLIMENRRMKEELQRND